MPGRGQKMLVIVEGFWSEVYGMKTESDHLARKVYEAATLAKKKVKAGRGAVVALQGYCAWGCCTVRKWKERSIR